MALIGLVEECKRIAGQLHCARQDVTSVSETGAPSVAYESIRPHLASLQINAHSSQDPITATLPVGIHLEDYGAMPFNAYSPKVGIVKMGFNSPLFRSVNC